MKLAWADQGYTGEAAPKAARQRHRPVDREATRGEEGLRTAAAALGGGGKL